LCPHLVPVVPFGCSGSEGKSVELLWLLEDVVRIQIGTESYEDDQGKCYETGTVFHSRKEGDQKNPKGSVVGYPDKGEWVSAPLFD
jgi:hypothetical protein